MLKAVVGMLPSGVITPDRPMAARDVLLSWWRRAPDACHERSVT
jgi:hypothetical protein